MFDTKSIVYSKTLNKCLWIDDLLKLQDDKNNFTLFATNNNKITNPDHMFFSSIEKIDKSYIKKHDFYCVKTKLGFEIIIPDNNKIFLEAKAPNTYKESHILYNLDLILKNIEKQKILLRIAIPTFFTEAEYDANTLKSIDRNGAILALFLSSYSSLKGPNPSLKFALHEKPFIKKIQNVFSKEFKIEELIRNIFGDEVYHDLKIYVDEQKRSILEKPYKFIIEDKHTDLYNEVLNDIFYLYPYRTKNYNSDNFMNLDIGFTNGKQITSEVIRFFQTEMSPRMIYSFIYHLLKIESFNNDYENFYALKIENPYIKQMVQQLALIGNIILDDSNRDEKIILDEKFMRKPTPFIYDEVTTVYRITDEIKEKMEFAKISIPLNRLIVNGFSTYIED